ncbi:MAG: DUF2436 domain-containing protein [Clostridia bacterium]|nr:DUF2436 domain-containing protein [Clostridia bacterium]
MAKKLLALLVAAMMVMVLVPMNAFAAADVKTAPNPGHVEAFVDAADDFVPPAEGCARITLTVGDVWGDGSGYQMLLDADATAFGSIIPATGALTTSGDVPEATYAEFEYKIPENADGALTTENIVINNSITIEIPAGTYDWCITNPTPGDRMWIASDQGNVGGRADDYEFEEGYSYTFEVSLMGSNDGTDVTITDPTGYTPEPPTPVLGFYFEDEAEVAEFTIINNDTSTYTWERYNSNAYEGSYCMRVHWQVTPSDWLITPAVELLPVDPAVTFYAKAHSANYPETIKVYVGTAPEIDAMTQLGDEVTLTTAYMQYEYDLADYAGETIYFAIEYTGDDAYYAYVDQIEFWGESGSEPNVIDSIAIDGFTVPAWGEHPDFNVEVPEDANYSVDYTAWTVVIDGNNETMISSDMFDSEEYSYFMSIRLVPDEGYEFEDLPEVTINGDPSLVNYAHTNGDGELLVYSIEFTVEEPVAQTDPITTIEINGFVEPEWGANPFYGVTVPEDAHYSKIQGLWYRYNASGPMNPDDTFNDPDEQYYMYFFFVPMEGYEFADDVTVLINGSAALVFFSTAENGGISVYTNYFTVEEPSGGNELDEALNIEGGTLHFETSESYPWIVVDDGNRLFAQSGNAGVSSSSSTLTTVVTLEAGALITFDFKAWGEGSSSFWDHCDFYVNSDRILYYGAYDNEWETFTFSVEEAGEYTLTWVYTKDSSVNPTGDYFAVDNVYVGEPVLPEAINVFDVTVKANRNTYVVYTMEPDDVTATEVTFEIADTSIATIDENGMIHGVAVGETTVTVTSVADPTVSGTATVTVTEPDPEVQLYGYATYDIGGTFSENWITFTDMEPGDVTALGTADDAYAAAYYDGFVYGYRQEDSAFFKMNAETYEVEYPEDGAALEGVTALDMAYNYANQTMYLLAQDNDTYNMLLFTVDLETGAVSECGQLSIPSGGILALTCDGEGNLYGLGYSSTSAGFYGIDVETLECTLIGETGVPMNYVQSMHYDMNTGRLFWAQIFSTSSNGLYEIDPETGAAELLGTIGENGMEVTGLYTIYYEDEPQPQPQIIDTIEINDFVEPAWGDAPDYGITVPDDAHYYIDDAAWFWWFNGDGGMMGDDDIFNVPSVAYYMGIIIFPEEGYEFAEEVTVLINGETEFVWGYYDEDGYLEIYTIDFIVCFYGDVDLDGEVTAADALLAMRYAMGVMDLTEEQLVQMDVNGDGLYDLVDATLILRYAMGIIDHFPVEPDPIPTPR